jgi:hypothetical protein
MIYRYLLAALCICAPLGALGQLRVELSFEQETYLPHEPMYAVVRIINSSGQKLVLGNDDEWLTFDVEPAQGGVVKQKKPADVKGEFTLPNGSRARKRVNLAEAFELSKFGRYNVSATVRVREWGETFSSRKPVPVGIATGVKLWESAFGMPSEQKNGRPEVRKFQLLQANHLKQLSLYVRITDESETDTYSLFPLGSLVGFSRPEPQLDRWSNLHVFYQDSSHTFKYFTITPDGLMLARQTWEIGESRPGMILNSDGRISVTGGVRRVSGTDLPPPELLSEKSSPGTGAPEPLESEKPSDAQNAVK